MDERIKFVEGSVGGTLPADYLSFLSTHVATDQNLVVSSNPDYWGVRMLFELGCGPKDNQLDNVYDLVADVLPDGTLPIAEDWGGNLFLLKCTPPGHGTVLWWDHEREHGDERVEVVSKSFSDFQKLLVPDKA